MHPDKRFHWTDREAIHAFVAETRFGTLFLATPNGPRTAHVPVIWQGEDRLAFHLSRANALAPHIDGARALLVVNGPHGYVSPDYYCMDDQVPTWNYVAAELEGRVTAIDAAGLPALIDALSAESEQRLAPKPAWTRDKMTGGLFERMLGAITGYRLEVDTWRGTRKLGQNKPAAARKAAADGMARAGDTAIAALMRDIAP